MLLGRSLALAPAALLALASSSGCGAGTPPAPAAAACVAATEVCNGADDDCDGAVDEDLGNVACGTGACAVTVAACGAGAAVRCDPRPPGVETCNGVDDDCDGDVDEGCACTPGATRACYAGPAGTAGVGECRAGAQSCDGGQWGPCVGAVLPRDEACNGVDDDCDGRTDEVGGQACATGLPGACSAGVVTCTAQGAACAPLAVRSPDLCNGLDDDCDPTTADGAAETWLGQACDGPDADQCTGGKLACVGGARTCVETGGAKEELCNGIDDDCDGRVDEDFDLAADAACADATFLGTVVGDAGSDALAASDWREAWFRVAVRDEPGAQGPRVGATVTLATSPVRQVVLEVFLGRCGGALQGREVVGPDRTAAVRVQREDRPAVDDGFEILVHLSESGASTACGPWTLGVRGSP